MTGARIAASAIVLGGGRSTRFGRDKLAEPVAGRPLVEHAILAVASLADDVVVLGPRPSRADPDIYGVRIRHAPDAEPFSGPLVALSTGLELVREPLAIVVGGDMPTLSPSVLAVLVQALDAADGADAAVLLYRGRREPLPMVVRVGSLTPVVRRLVGAGERRLGALFDAIRVRALHETEWRPLDPNADTLRDIDEPADLAR